MSSSYASNLATSSDYTDTEDTTEYIKDDDVSLFSNPLELPKVSDEDLKEELGFNKPKPVSGHVSLFSAHIADKHAGGWKWLPGDKKANFLQVPKMMNVFCVSNITQVI